MAKYQDFVVSRGGEHPAFNALALHLKLRLFPEHPVECSSHLPALDHILKQIEESRQLSGARDSVKVEFYQCLLGVCQKTATATDLNQLVIASAVAGLVQQRALGLLETITISEARRLCCELERNAFSHHRLLRHTIATAELADLPAKPDEQATMRAAAMSVSGFYVSQQLHGCGMASNSYEQVVTDLMKDLHIVLEGNLDKYLELMKLFGRRNKGDWDLDEKLNQLYQGAQRTLEQRSIVDALKTHAQIACSLGALSAMGITAQNGYQRLLSTPEPINNKECKNYLSNLLMELANGNTTMLGLYKTTTDILGIKPFHRIVKNQSFQRPAEATLH